jgi:hypothetical protein
MNPEPLPAELRDLKAQLATRPSPELPPELRARILGGPNVPLARPWRGWRWLAVAAVVAVALNIGLSIDNAGRFHQLAGVTNMEPPRAARDVEPTADPFQQYAASALASLRPAPSPGSVERSLFSHER